ncbi:MAG: hypothetical protein Q7R33_07910 [Nitrosarchaeum sp.]|nr:hypothetical protein [Nitrosarchaeum sp.]
MNSEIKWSEIKKIYRPLIDSTMDDYLALFDEPYIMTKFECVLDVNRQIGSFAI